ncbi:MAG: gliding motility-associated-like protein, partial [Vicingaceae bacterium]
ATDVNGNVDSASAVVTVTDSIKPTVITQAVTVYLDATGNATITTTDIDNGTADNCGTPALALSNTTFDCANVGANTVQLIATDVNGNVDSASAVVTVVDSIIPIITCTSDTITCNPVFTFSTPVGSDNCAIQSIVQSSGIPSGGNYPVGTTINTFIITDVNGNVDSCSFTVTREDFPTLATAGADVNICVDTFDLNANTPIVGIGSWSTLTTSVTFDDNTSSSTTIRGLVRGENVLIWTISNGVCDPSRDTITVTYDDQPTFSFAGADITLCEVYEISLGGNSATIGIGTWSTISGSASIMSPNVSNSFVSNLSDGLNQLVWTISNGTCNDSFDTVNIVVGKNPIVDVGPDKTVFKDDGATLSAVITPDSLNSQNLTYQWQPSFLLDDASSSSTSTGFGFEEDTEFTVLVTSEQGCIGRDSISVFVKTLLEIPTSFTPNGDGINDVWEIKNFEQFAKMEVVVYDPLGSEVYSTSRYNYWNGRRDGNDLPVTTYYYVITVTDFGGKTEALNGIVTILR